jgi:CheY-like chemotaxis protein
MSIPASLIPSIPVPKKRVLLVDTLATKRDLRAKIMRQLGADVDCAADISEARSLWQADSYSLVLVDVRNDAANVQEFCDEVRGAKPPQTVAFLVGQPEYLSNSPAPDGVAAANAPGKNGPWGEMVVSLFANACEALPRRWGFQEASLRIAAVRTMHDPRRVMKATTNPKLPRFSWADAIKNHSVKAAV